jgi:energy-coupling factor transporter ATP-binding protein EcfA2
MTDLFSLDDIELSTPTTLALSDSDVFSRLVYMLKTMKLELPSWLKYKIQFINDIEKPLVLFSPLMKAAFNKGAVYGETSIEEFKQVLHTVVAGELKTFEDNKRFWDYVNSLSEGLFEQNEETWLEDLDSGEEIEKFNSGFGLFDKAVNGWYQSIVTVAGTPGSGKTTLLLSLMGQLARFYPVWYYQTEIPGSLIKTRIKKIKPPTFDKGCKVFTGNYSTDSILAEIKRNPDSNRIIIYDSPEIKPSALDTLPYWEKVYQDLVSIKMNCRMVIVTSQTKQNIGWDDLGIYSLSDSAAKARYSDVILYIGRILDTVLVKTAKNRFGSLGTTSGLYDYQSMQMKTDFVDSMFE